MHILQPHPLKRGTETVSGFYLTPVGTEITFYKNQMAQSLNTKDRMPGIHTVLTCHVEVHILPRWLFPSTNNIFYQWLMPWDEESPRYKTLVKCWELTIVPARVNLSQQLQLWTSHCFLPGNVRLRRARPLRVRAGPLQDRPFWVGLLILLPNSGLAACH